MIGIIATAAITGPLYTRLMWWSWSLAMLSWLCAGLLLLRIGAAVWPHVVIRWRRVGMGVLAVGVAAACVTLTVRVTDTPFQVAGASQRVTELSAIMRRTVGHGSVLIDYRGGYLERGVIVSGVMAQMARDGVRVVVPREIGQPQFPDDRLVARDRFRGPHLVVTGPEAVMLPPGKSLGASDPLNARGPAQLLWRI